MASTVFVDNSSIIYASWLNDVNATIYNGTFISPTITPQNLVCNGSVSGTGFTGLVNNTLSAPGQIGNGTPNTGAFTTLSLTTALSIANGGTGLTVAGSAGSVLTSNGTSWSISPKITSGTAVSASGASIDFTGIPSWVKRITVMFSGVSTSSTSNLQIQIGSGSVETSGYVSYVNQFGGASTTNTTSSTGIGLTGDATGGAIYNGTITICNISSNSWVSSSVVVSNTLSSTAGGSSIGATSKAISGTLDRVRITTVNGTDTFDAGSINILYE